MKAKYPLLELKKQQRVDEFMYFKKEVIQLINDKKKLNLGSNTDIRSEYVNIDILNMEGVEVQWDITSLSEIVGPATVNEILLYDVLEHFPFARTGPLLHQWVSRLIPDGNSKIIVRVPDLEKISRKMLSGELPVFEAQRLIFGGQDYEFNFHMAGFTGGLLEGYLLGAGCKEIIQIVREEESHNVTLVARV